MTEKSYYAKLDRYYLAYGLREGRSITWEAKFSRTHRIPFKALAAHQEEKLLKSMRAYGQKIADAGIMQKPFDGYVVVNAEAFFVAIYFLPRHTEVYEIHIRNFVDEKYRSTEKSLTKERAAEIGNRLPL